MNILLPVDGSEHSRRAVQYAGYLGSSLGKALTEIALLRVITGRYMKSFMPFFDFRSDLLKQTDSFKKFKKRHIRANINPSLDESAKILEEAGIEMPVARFVAEGHPSSEIIRLADEKNFSTIIMARRGLSKLKGIMLGSVTNMVVHRATKQTVYVVGQQIPAEKACPVRKILIPVDGSAFSLQGVEHGALLAQSLDQFVDTITLLRVINLAFYETRRADKIDMEGEAKKILDEAKQILLKRGVRERLITARICAGDPAEEILKEAKKRKHDTILLGRKGRTALRDFLLGGVSTKVMQRCFDKTIALTSSA